MPSLCPDCNFYIPVYLLLDNQDPVAKMCGERFATISGSDTSTYRYVEEIMREKPQSKQTEGQDDTQVRHLGLTHRIIGHYVRQLDVATFLNILKTTTALKKPRKFCFLFQFIYFINATEYLQSTPGHQNPIRFL